MSFDELKHPRAPKGTEIGGQFISAARTAAGLERTEGEQELKGYVEGIAEWGGSKTKESYILEFGEFFEKGEFPEGEIMGELGNCYQNATNMALFTDKYTYVEGVATTLGLGIPMNHAWVIDNKTGLVIDPTWLDGDSYYGVKFSDVSLSGALLETKMYGILGYVAWIKAGGNKDNLPYFGN